VSRRTRREERGVVLALVLVLALLMTASVVTFTRRAVIDTTIVKNRDDAAAAEALARGGVRAALAALGADGLLQAQAAPASGRNDLGGQGGSRLGSGLPGAPPQPGAGLANPTEDPCSVLNGVLPLPPDASLTVTCQDTGALLNLNAIGFDDLGNPDEEAEEFLKAFLEEVIDDLGLPPGEAELYDARELAQNLLDYIDPNEDRISTGGHEDDYYRTQNPPYSAPNLPLLSVKEIGLVEGFDLNDGALAKALENYLSVFPLSGAQGVNLNTAPPHLLRAAVYHGNSGRKRLADDEVVTALLEVRAEGKIFCTGEGAGRPIGPKDGPECVSPFERGKLLENETYPPISLPSSAAAFRVTSTAKVGQMERTIETVIDRGDLAKPRLLFWRVE